MVVLGWFEESFFWCTADWAFVRCFAFNGVSADAAHVVVYYFHWLLVFQSVHCFGEEFRVYLFHLVCYVEAPCGLLVALLLCGFYVSRIHFIEFEGFAGNRGAQVVQG